MRLLLLSDIHGNWPALSAVARTFVPESFDAILNCGDTLVYAPFHNEVITWLRRYRVVSICGNTDRKVQKLLRGKSFKKPAKQEKRVMYEQAAEKLTKENALWLLALKKSATLKLAGRKIALFHGSPADHNEFLFPDTPCSRFAELAATVGSRGVEIVITGHSHTPYLKKVAGVWFINPGSVGRMFDGNPQAACAILKLGPRSGEISLTPHRVSWDLEEMAARLHLDHCPPIYEQMYRSGKKLN